MKKRSQSQRLLAPARRVKFLKRLPSDGGPKKPRLEPTIEIIAQDPEERWGLVKTYATLASARAMATYLRKRHNLEFRVVGKEIWARRLTL